MAIDEFVLSGLINNNILSMEYNVQQIFEHQIKIEAAASNTKYQQDILEKLLDGARAYLSCEGNQISVELNFLNIPKGAEDYAELIKSNSVSIIEPRLQDLVMETFSLDDVQEQLRSYIIEEASGTIQNAIGGSS